MLRWEAKLNVIGKGAFGLIYKFFPNEFANAKDELVDFLEKLNNNPYSECWTYLESADKYFS